MILSISLICDYSNFKRYAISEYGEFTKKLPDLMRIRLYGINDTLISESNSVFLPTIYDILEFDCKTREWFIVNFLNAPEEIDYEDD